MAIYKSACIRSYAMYLVSHMLTCTHTNTNTYICRHILYTYIHTIYTRRCEIYSHIFYKIITLAQEINSRQLPALVLLWYTLWLHNYTAHSSCNTVILTCWTPLGLTGYTITGGSCGLLTCPILLSSSLFSWFKTVIS